MKIKLNDVANKIYRKRFKLQHSLHDLIEEAGLGCRYEEVLHNSVQESTKYAVWFEIEYVVAENMSQHETN
jgi:hypothetical protein